MPAIESADGSIIGYEVLGDGAPVVLIGGAFNDRRSVGALAAALAADGFAAVAYDRRGRGGSGEAGPWSVRREVEDLGAIVQALGGSAAVFGHSSGAALALAGAAAGLPLTRLALYEPSFRPWPFPEGVVEGVREALAADDRDAAARRFLTGAVGVPETVVAGIAGGPGWPAMTALAHTLPADLELSLPGGGLPGGLAALRQPVLVLTGGRSPGWWAELDESLAAAVPDGRHELVPDADHSALQHPGSFLVPLLGFLRADRGDAAEGRTA